MLSRVPIEKNIIIDVHCKKNSFLARITGAPKWPLVGQGGGGETMKNS